MAPRKVDFALSVRATATKLARALNEIDVLAGIFTASGYMAGGSNPITAEDLTGFDITVDQLAEFTVLAMNLRKFVSNDITALVDDYRSQLDAFREV